MIPLTMRASICLALLMSLGSTPLRAEPATHARVEAHAADDQAAHPIRAGLEMFGILAVGTTWYWVYRKDNAVDWDDPDLKARVSGEAWRFDNNGIGLNFIAHPFSGTAFYAVARANHLGPKSSVGYSFLTSFLWEYVIEFREKVSINDVVVTPFAGMAMGEFFHKLGVYLNSPTREANVAQRALGWSLGPSVALHRVVDGDRRLGAPPPDPLGYSKSVFHSFDLEFEHAWQRTNHRLRSTRQGLGFRGRFVDIPGYHAPGRFERWLSDAEVTELSVSVERSAHGAGFELTSETLLLGHYFQNVAGSIQAPSGVSTLLSTNVGYRYQNSGARGIQERLGALSLPALGTDFEAWSESWSFQLSSRAALEFAGVGAVSYAAFSSANPALDSKAILDKKGYYYAYGGSGRTCATLGWGPFELSAEARAALYDSIEGLTRAQERVELDVEAKDTNTSLSLEFAVEPTEWLRFGFGAKRTRSVSTVGEFHTTSELEEYGLGVGIRMPE